MVLSFSAYSLYHYVILWHVLAEQVVVKEVILPEYYSVIKGLVQLFVEFPICIYSYDYEP